MASAAARDLKIGTIIDKTLGVIEVNAMPALVYLLAMTAAGIPISYFSVGSLDVMQIVGGQVLKSVIGMVLGYFLLVAMVRRTGLQSPMARDALLPYIGMSLLSSLAVMLGMIVFILPGLFLMARWSIAQPLLVSRGGGVMASLGESWERTSGNELSIFGAALAVMLVPIAIVIASGSLFEPGDIAGIVVSELATSGINLLLLAMGVALLGLIVGREAPAAPLA